MSKVKQKRKDVWARSVSEQVTPSWTVRGGVQLDHHPHGRGMKAKMEDLLLTIIKYLAILKVIGASISLSEKGDSHRKRKLERTIGCYMRIEGYQDEFTA